MDGFTALADPTRRAILDLLIGGERDAGSIAASFDISRPAVSRHLRVLREAGIVEARSDAQRRVYSVRSEGLVSVDQWLAKYRVFWSRSLDVLELALAQGDKTDEHQ
ncbi:MAG: metalloregulator ArsR/SmtB family transcription factor [Acidimicrobiia bacterium]|nr:metalloregulator ArsR/SmtB family transcription factor [Acidimicrobiia bacterium]